MRVTMTQFTGAPIFHADQHIYETPESLTTFPDLLKVIRS